ncbi:uncharacterized protein PAC_15155 [Phialocephala subalpina]|uniref:Uncharacterized protein n=1 Tax=Phialocephala subalpina TaxID=576137 RepID=A0A1L7XJN1_9HELO|nr:uncharacterized protein PAC_15155 [Phialocephala subalpina]
MIPNPSHAAMRIHCAARKQAERGVAGADLQASTRHRLGTPTISSRRTSAISGDVLSGALIRIWITNSPPASASPSKKSSHTGAIAGGVVGGIAGLALLGAGSIYIDSGDTYTPQENTTFSDTGSAYDKGMNVNLLVLDLSKNFTANDTFPYRTIHKPPGVPPALEDSALWYSAETGKIYQLAIPRAAIWEFFLSTANVTDEIRFDLTDRRTRYGVFAGAFAENQIGISSESGDDMASRPGWDMIANLKARAVFRARDAVFVIGVKEGIMGDPEDDKKRRRL